MVGEQRRVFLYQSTKPLDFIPSQGHIVHQRRKGKPQSVPESSNPDINVFIKPSGLLSTPIRPTFVPAFCRLKLRVISPPGVSNHLKYKN